MLFIAINLAALISLPLPFHSLFGGIHRSCNILQQVQEGGRVCERTVVVHGTFSY